MVTGIRTQSRIPAKHKITTHALEAGDAVIMYGVCVGRATAAIPAGGLLTIRNVAHDAVPYAIRKSNYRWDPPDVTQWRDREFLGYRRSDGQVGTANHWLVLPLVFCENHNVEVLRSAFEHELGYGTAAPYRQ